MPLCSYNLVVVHDFSRSGEQLKAGAQHARDEQPLSTEALPSSLPRPP